MFLPSVGERQTEENGEQQAAASPEGPASGLVRIKVRGLAHVAAGILGVWGAIAAAKGFYDIFLGGTPEANLYAPEPWAFVTREQWARYARFELVYGAACLLLAAAVVRYARFLPELVERPSPE
jgi:hypothetical protein